MNNEAVAILAERATHADVAQDRRLDTVEDMIRDIRDGRTSFQQSQVKTLRLLTFQVQALAMQKVILPSALALSAFLLGGLAGVMILEHFR